MKDKVPSALALGGNGEIGDACRAVVEHLGRDARLRPAVYLARGGRLRCTAAASQWRPLDGVPPSAGAIGRAYRTGDEVVGTDRREAAIPIRCLGDLVGVLHVTADEPLRAGDVDAGRAVAEALGDRIRALGGPEQEASARRLLRHVARLTTLEDPAEIGRVVLAAALDVTPLDSAALLRRGALGAHEIVGAAGPLAATLAGVPGRVTDALAALAAEGGSSYSTGPGAEGWPPALRALRAKGVEALAVAGLFSQGALQGLLVVGAGRPLALDTDDAELLELLAAHAASALRAAEALRSLRLRAATDPLTGLGHHATFHEALGSSHRRPNTAVLLADIDGFKALNDTFGHQHGDSVLRGTAYALGGALRRGDTLYRVGGDEFAALLVVADESEALEAGARLRDAVHEAGLGVTVSIGVAVPRGGEADGEVLARADRALYRVKASGRDGVALASDEPLATDATAS